MNGYAIMAIIGAVVWAIMTAIYAVKYKQGIRARKWYGVIAYCGLAALVGGGLQYFSDTVNKTDSFWIMAALVVFIYLTGKIYIMNNIER